ncbi:hypothetical protein A8C32_10070 [Flavivirga aquatica]|uniref:Gp5/Type VI secretion system Vgr protein OB-fold domain-containing protein n=1 Tax=Flavivirga aquatica TaxID=1849968 RepID=A0A1E5TES5_9FLAO|nr:phage baseplate assembly protein V [Flavivirga aquatica]OEK09848.1 hypothetical protein A8C32_10070 [Flavivirga aquatica]
MNNVTSISLDGKRLKNFQKLKIKECINEHAKCVLDVDIAELQSRGSHTIDAVRELLGRPLLVTFEKGNAIDLLFLIVDISIKNKQGHEGVFRIKAASKSIKLNGLPSNRSWLNKSLENIVKDVIDETGIEAQIQPQYKGSIEYMVRYQESNWDFLKRLAKTYSEPLQNDGVKLVVGPQPFETPLELEYGRELSNIKLDIKTRAVNHAVYSYNAEEDALNESKAKNNIEGLNELSMSSLNTSLEMYPDSAIAHTEARTKNKSEVDDYTAKKQASAAADLHVLEADCNVQGLKLGRIINVKSALNQGSLGGFDLKNYGEYKIIEIKHKATGKGTYQCHFKAIPSGIIILPEPKVALPKANAQVATVISNEDPRGMGRIKVQMGWQKHQDTTSWIRVLSGDSGSSSNHEQNRGHVFIPEVGDQVMVGFRYSDPQRPFVLGSLFHGNNGAGGGIDNTKKSIITRSGHVIEFNDTDRAESITITDKNKNIIFIDTANKNIKISAPETIDIEAKNINMRAEEKIYMQAQHMETQIGEDKIVGVGNNLEITAESSYKLSTTEHSETIEGNKTVNIQSSLSVNASDAELIAGNGDINIQGPGITTVQGGQDVKVSKG